MTGSKEKNIAYITCISLMPFNQSEKATTNGTIPTSVTQKLNTHWY